MYRVPADGNFSTTKPVEMRLFYSGADTLRAHKTLQGVANQLNADGFKSPRGCKWHPSTVRKALLRNAPDACTSHLQGSEIGSIPSVFGPPQGEGRKTEGAFMPTDLMQAWRMIDLFSTSAPAASP